jgi:hypothetical protein
LHEEADQIAVHFRTEDGELQRRVIGGFVRVDLANLYLHPRNTARLVQNGKCATSRLRRQKQKVISRRSMTSRSTTKNAMRFAQSQAGIKCFRMMALQAIGIVHAHLEEVADEARKTIRSRGAIGGPYVANVLKQ